MQLSYQSSIEDANESPSDTDAHSAVHQTLCLCVVVKYLSNRPNQCVSCIDLTTLLRKDNTHTKFIVIATTKSEHCLSESLI